MKKNAVPFQLRTCGLASGVQDSKVEKTKENLFNVCCNTLK